MYPDATRRSFSPHDQQSHPHQQQQTPGQPRYYPEPRANLLQTQSQITSNPVQSHAEPLHFNQQTQMQSFTGYGDAASMPPPSSMSGMNMNLGATRTSQQHQGYMRSNNQPIPPSSPGYIQSPTTPVQSGQQFYGQPTQSPTKPPTSQPQMAAGSPQVGNNPLQQLQKQMVSGPGEVSKMDGARIDLLLELNRILIQEVMQLQANGRAGSAVKQGQDAQAGQQSPTASDAKDAIEGDGEKKGEDANKKGPPPSREYIECMLRLRGNFAYLTNLASRNSQKPQPVMERPTIMEPLSANIEGNTISEDSMNTIRDMYKRLKELFPPGQQQQQQQQQQSSQVPGQVQTQQHMQQQQPAIQHQQQQQQQQQQQGLTPQQQQAQNMQHQIMQHQQQMAAQSGNMQGMPPVGMGRGQNMNPQMMQQQMMARAMANMQHQQGGMGPGM